MKWTSFVMMFFLLPMASACYSASNDPSSENITPTTESNIGYDVIISYLRDDLNNINIKMSSVENAGSKVSNKVDVLHQKYDFLSKEISEAKNSYWSIYGVVVGIIAITITLGGIGVYITIRENTNSKRALELQDKELSLQRKELEEKFEFIVAELAQKANKELNLFQKRMRLQEILLESGDKAITTDLQNELYEGVRYLDSDPRVSYISLYKKILRLSLDNDVKKSVEEALNNAKDLLETNCK
ncbi:hypothetical protein [Marinobacterium sp. BA1]|uniref:hypothetical protein n=1 Tax=Marinobacterium sp. BA1 TaxID=3138931 RepID=UPI0032E6BE3A